MDLRSLRYYVAVAEERHVGRAAVRLHMTQPPLSRAIKQLETELGAVLLHRSSTGVTLTAAGTVLYDEARRLLEQAEQVRDRVAATAGATTITLGILADSAEHAGTRLAAAFRQRHPKSISVSAKPTSPTRLRGCGQGWSMSRSSGHHSTPPGSAPTCCDQTPSA